MLWRLRVCSEALIVAFDGLDCVSNYYAFPDYWKAKVEKATSDLHILFLDISISSSVCNRFSCPSSDCATPMCPHRGWCSKWLHLWKSCYWRGEKMQHIVTPWLSIKVPCFSAGWASGRPYQQTGRHRSLRSTLVLRRAYYSFMLSIILVATKKFKSVLRYSLDWHPADHVSFFDNVHLRPLATDGKVSYYNILNFSHTHPISVLNSS